MQYKLTIEPNQGYSPDQTRKVTVAELQDLLDGLDPDDEICTYDYQNSYGAKFGGIRLELEPIYEDEENN